MTSSIKRRSIVLSFVLLAITAFQSYGQLSIQSAQIGLKGGGNFYKTSGRSFDNKTNPSFSAGAYAELNFTPQWSLQPELSYSETISQTSEEFGQIYPGAVSSKLYSNYISLPVMVAFKPVPELAILLGPQFDYLVAQTTGVLPPTYNNKDVFAKANFGIIFGGQLNLGKVKVGARYYIGINDVNGINSTDDWRMHGLQAYVGYQLWDLKMKKKK